MGEMFQASYLATCYVTGEYTCRDHRDDKGNRPPMKPIELAKQREAIRLLQDEILSDKAFHFKPELLPPPGARPLARHRLLVLSNRISIRCWNTCRRCSGSWCRSYWTRNRCGPCRKSRSMPSRGRRWRCRKSSAP